MKWLCIISFFSVNTISKTQAEYTQFKKKSFGRKYCIQVKLIFRKYGRQHIEALYENVFLHCSITDAASRIIKKKSIQYFKLNVS